jgi:hypothetical protein
MRGPTGQAIELLTVVEPDPLSYPDVYVWWSEDSRAVFLWGSHAGLGCADKRGRKSFGYIYTLSDRQLWDAGAKTVSVRRGS